MYQWSPWPSLIQKCSPDIQKCSPDIEEFSILGHFSYARSLFCNLLSACLLSIYYVWCCKGTSHQSQLKRWNLLSTMIMQVHCQLIFLTITMMLYLKSPHNYLVHGISDSYPPGRGRGRGGGRRGRGRGMFFHVFSIHSKVLAIVIVS